MMTELLIILLFIFMILGALAALSLEDLLSSVLAFGAVGLCLSAAFVALRAPDVALVQFIAELFLLLILVRTTVTKEESQSRSARAYTGAFFTLSLMVVFAFFLYPALRQVPVFGQGFPRFSQVRVQEDLTMEGAGDILSTFIAQFRGFDALLETIIVFAALIACIAIINKGTETEHE